MKAVLAAYLPQDKRDMNPNTDINMSLRSLRLRRVVLFVLVLFSTGSGSMLMG